MEDEVKNKQKNARTKMANTMYKFRIGQAVRTNRNAPIGPNHAGTVSHRWTDAQGVHWYMVGGLNHSEAQLDSVG